MQACPLSLCAATRTVEPHDERGLLRRVHLGLHEHIVHVVALQLRRGGWQRCFVSLRPVRLAVRSEGSRAAPASPRSFTAPCSLPLPPPLAFCPPFVLSSIPLKVREGSGLSQPGRAVTSAPCGAASAACGVRSPSAAAAAAAAAATAQRATTIPHGAKGQVVCAGVGGLLPGCRAARPRAGLCNLRTWLPKINHFASAPIFENWCIVKPMFLWSEAP